MSDAAQVRSAEASDSGAIVRLLRQLGYERDATSAAHDIATGSAGDVIVAIRPEALVGVLTMKIHRQFHWGALVASIEALVVDENSRSSGVGGALLAVAAQRARDAGCILLELHSNHDRTRARRFYEREGFQVTSNYFIRWLT